MTEIVIGRPGRLVGPAPGRNPGAIDRPAAPERSLPTSRPAAGTVARPATARPAIQARARADTARPYHLAVAIGAAAGVYAVSLAGVTALQAGTDAAIEAGRRPTAEAIAAIRADNDALEAAVGRIEASYTNAADAYAAITAAIADHEAALGGLAGITGTIEGTVASLPSTIKLPSVSRTAAVRVTVRPATNATTAASGKP